MFTKGQTQRRISSTAFGMSEGSSLKRVVLFLIERELMQAACDGASGRLCTAHVQQDVLEQEL